MCSHHEPFETTFPSSRQTLTPPTIPPLSINHFPMKPNRFHRIILAGAAFVACALGSQSEAASLGSAFTYQGQLNDATGPANGSFDFLFRLYTVPTGGTALPPAITNAAVLVKDGRFTTILDFGDGRFTGTAYWLRIDVRTNTPDDSVTFTTLLPRQPVTPAPNALYADTAGTAAVVAPNAVTAAMIKDASITSEKLQSGIVVKSINGLEDNVSLLGGTNITIVTNANARTLTLSAGPFLVRNSTNVYYNGGNVGIGTLSPDAKLEVNNTNWVDSAIRITSSSEVINSVTPASKLELMAASGKGWSIDKDIAGNLDIHEAGSLFHRFSIRRDTGHVGIGDYGDNSRYASRVLSIAGDPNADSFPGTSAVLFKGLASGTWAISTYTDGNLHITKDGNDTDEEVVVPALRVVGGSDIAEPFNVTSDITPKPGMVVSIDPDRTGELRVSTRAYDSTVAGIVSGAGGVRTGMTLNQQGTAASGKLPVALTGRVYCYVDADAGGPIQPGDLLTTSPTPGHAMKAADRNRATGAMLGKAMSPLKEGKGLVLVLVSLQ